MEPIVIQPSVHSEIGASSAHRWMNCPGSVRLSRIVPKKKASEAMSAGTVAHYVGQQCLDGMRRADEFIGQVFVADDREIMFTREMAEPVQFYVDFVLYKVCRNSLLGVEQPLSLAHIHPALHGTCDAVLTIPTLRIDVMDYKHGSGHAVSAIANPQLRIYALGGIGEKNPHKVKEAYMRIVQPRMDDSRLPQEKRFDTMQVRELVEWGYEVLKPAAERCFSTESPFVCGEWCDTCPAAARCEHQAKDALDHAGLLLPEMGDVVAPEARTMSIEQMVRVYESFPKIEAFLKTVRERMIEECRNGNPMVPYKLVEETEGRTRNWNSEVEAAKVFAPMLGKDAYSEPALKSVAEMEKALVSSGGYAKADAAKLIAPLFNKRLKNPKQTLVPVNDPRRPLNVSEGLPELD